MQRAACLTADALTNAVASIKGAIQIVYPAGLPAWEPVQEIFDDREDLTGSAVSSPVARAAISKKIICSLMRFATASCCAATQTSLSSLV